MPVDARVMALASILMPRTHVVDYYCATMPPMQKLKQFEDSYPRGTEKTSL